MILLSDELSLVANNSKIFSIIRNNLDSCKHSEIYLILNFQRHYHGFNGIKCKFGKGKISNKLMIFVSDRKKTTELHHIVENGHGQKELGATTWGRGS